MRASVSGIDVRGVRDLAQVRPRDRLAVAEPQLEVLGPEIGLHPGQGQRRIVGIVHGREVIELVVRNRDDADIRVELERVDRDRQALEVLPAQARRDAEPVVECRVELSPHRIDGFAGEVALGADAADRQRVTVERIEDACIRQHLPGRAEERRGRCAGRAELKLVLQVAAPFFVVVIAAADFDDVGAGLERQHELPAIARR